MINLLSAITAQLKTAHNRIYLSKAPEGATMPYGVYTLPSENVLEHREDFLINVELWDVNPDTTELETLVKTISDTMHRFRYNESGLSVRVYKVSGGLMIPDPDPNLNRRLLTFQARTYFN